MEYYDKNKRRIKAGDTIMHDNGDIEKVYECGENGEDLGVNATNPEYAKHHDVDPQFYPLSNFYLAEWTVVND